jgi:hypothetical protein
MQAKAVSYIEILIRIVFFFGCCSCTRQVSNPILPGTFNPVFQISNLNNYLAIIDSSLDVGKRFQDTFADRSLEDRLALFNLQRHEGFIIYPADEMMPYEIIFYECKFGQPGKWQDSVLKTLKDSGNIGRLFFFQPMRWTMPDIMLSLRALSKIEVPILENLDFFTLEHGGSVCKVAYVSPITLWCEPGVINKSIGSFIKKYMISIWYKNYEIPLFYKYNGDFSEFFLPLSFEAIVESGTK